MKLLVTGATGKVGQSFLRSFFEREKFKEAQLVALCNRRSIPAQENVRVVMGSISDANVVSDAMEGVTHILHLAAVKETPDKVVDVAMKGMFNLLEAARVSPTLKQFVLLSGDCVVGHIFKEYDSPITEDSPRRGYKGTYALTKVVEETMLEQYQYQYDLNGCILRAPWIMEKDDFRHALSFGSAQFGGPAWDGLLGADQIEKATQECLIPLMLDTYGRSLKRSFIHVSDLVQAIGDVLDNEAARCQLFNVCMDEPVDYGEVAVYLKAAKALSSITIPTPYFGNWLSNSKAKHFLGWAPVVGYEDMIERAWSYVRPANDPRKIWYPG